MADHENQLMWTQDVFAGRWSTAKGHTTEVGFTDWRLPTPDELATIYPHIPGLEPWDEERNEAKYFWTNEVSGSDQFGNKFIRVRNFNNGNTRMTHPDPERPNALWALGFQFDVTVDGRTLKLLNVIDEFTCEALAIEVGHSIDADHVVRVLDRLAAERGGAPAFVRFDIHTELRLDRAAVVQLAA